MPSIRIPLKSLSSCALVLSLVGCQAESAWLDDADLTPVARVVEALQLERPDTHLTLADVSSKGPRPDGYDFDVPDTIRIWRRSEGGSASCEGPVEVIDFETYVARVLSHEWYMSWNGESHKAGAIAIRSYAAWWVNAGGKYDCADVCDTTYTQAYGEESHANADEAVAATLGRFAVEDGSVVFAEYSSENSDPTEYGVSDPHCTGLERYGHGRGMCQWGTKRWADYDGKSPEWMVEHYYPGASVTGSFNGELDEADDDIDMRAGSTVTVEATFRNTGGATWNSGEVLLRTIDPELRSSAFYDPDTWANPEQVATLYGDVPVGDTGTFSFQLLAPSVTVETEYLETFALYSIGSDDWGAIEDPLELFIIVQPTSGGDDPPDDEDPSDEEDPDEEEEDDESGSGLGRGSGGDTGESGGVRRNNIEAGAEDDTSSKGCACSATAVNGTSAWVALGLFALVTRRRRHHPRDTSFNFTRTRTPSCRPPQSSLDSTPPWPSDSAPH